MQNRSLAPHRTHHGPSFGSFLAAILIVGAGAMCAAAAEDDVGIPNVSPTTQTAKAPPPPERPGDKDERDEKDLADLHDQRAEADKELAAISDPGALGRNAPSDVPEEQLVERRALLQHIVRAYDQQ